jgi:hypothetical protein
VGGYVVRDFTDRQHQHRQPLGANFDGNLHRQRHGAYVGIAGKW